MRNCVCDLNELVLLTVALTCDFARYLDKAANSVLCFGVCV